MSGDSYMSLLDGGTRTPDLFERPECYNHARLIVDHYACVFVVFVKLGDSLKEFAANEDTYANVIVLF